MSRAVRLTARNLQKVNVREWGTPTGPTLGRLWRSEKNRTITCLLPMPGHPRHLRIETRPVQIVDHHEDQWLPKTWKRAHATREPFLRTRFFRLP